MTIETKIATNNSKVDTANETARLAELKAEYDNLTGALLNDENISDSRDDYLRKLRADVRSEMKEIEAAIEAENSTAVATTYTTKVAKNGAINFYNVETGKRVKEADIVAGAIENDGIFYTASVHGYGVAHFCSKEFASPITAYKWICRMARKSNTYADGDACITVGFYGELIYTQKHSVNEIKNAELRTYVEAEMAEQIAEDDNNEREDLIHAQMHNNNLTREQAEQITDYLRANRQNYNAEIAATAKAMLDMFKKINNPETATVNVEINNAAEHTPASVEEKAEVVIPIVDYRTLLTWAEKVSNGQHDTAIQIVTHIKKWFNAETDKKTVIEVIKAGDLNGFRNFLCQFNFAVKDDGGCIHKLYRYDNGECVLAEIPTSEYAKYSTEEKTELPKGDITVESGAEAWAIVGKYFPKGNLEFYRAGKGFNNEDTFCYTLDEIIYVHVTCTPDNKRVKCIEIVNTYEESESERNILTVYINHDAEINTVTDTTPEYKYYIKSRRPIFGAAPNGYIKAVSGEVHEPVRRTNGTYSPKCRIYFATVIYDKPLTDEQILNYDLAVSNETFELLNAPPAQNEMSTISNIAETDGSEDDDFADEMPAPKLSTVKPDSPCAIANGLNDVFRGDTEFTSPTIADLTPPEPKMTATADEETDRERFLKASEYVITSLGRYLGTDKFGEDRFAVTWKTRCPLQKINKATARNILATFGLTTDAYLAEKAKWVADEIKRGSRQFAIDMQAEFLRDKIDADRKASVEPMPALFPADDSDDDDELIDAPEVKATADEFTAKLAAFDAEVTYAETARDAAKAAYDKADTVAQNAIAARQDFLDKTAGDLTQKLHEACAGNNFIETATLSGSHYTIGDITNIYIDPTLDGKFVFVTYNNRELARYDTPAQVEQVISRFKDAVERHKPVFHFPTVDELIDPPVKAVDAAHISDSLTRAMNIALEHYKGFCHVGNLTAATNELSLYNICRKAMTELWKEEAA